MRDDERARAQKLAEPDASSRTFLTLVVVGGGLAFGFLLGWLAARFDPEARFVGRVVGWGLAATLGIVMTRSFRAFEAVIRARFAEDVRIGEVEELAVETDEAVNLDTDHASVTPAIAIAIGEAELLLLAGPTLGEPEIFGASLASLDDDAFDKWWNGLPPPLAFPSRRFVITRLPTSGDILGIRVTGDYLPPARSVGVDLRMYNPLPSEIVPGAIARVADALPPRPA